MSLFTLRAASALVALATVLTASSATASAVKIRMSVDEDPIVPRLAESLGYLKDEGVEIVRVKVEDFQPEDYLMQEPLIKGQIDASYHWFNHAVFGARHNLPIQAVMVLNDAPGMTVMVANRVAKEIHGAADFKGRNIAEGAEYGTKAVLTNYLAAQAGLPPHSYKAVFQESQGRQDAVIQGLKDGKVDVMTFQEPITSALLASGLVTKLYDLNSKQGTVAVLGAAWPAQSLLMAPAYIAAHPNEVQHLVNALVRTMRFINTHSTDQIIAKLPAGYFDGKDKPAEIAYIRKTLPSFAKDDYTVSAKSARLVVASIQASSFDDSEEGKWRGTAENPQIDPDRLYDNRFVERAMDKIK